MPISPVRSFDVSNFHEIAAHGKYVTLPATSRNFYAMSACGQFVCIRPEEIRDTYHP